MEIINTKHQKAKIIHGPAVAIDAVLFTIEQEQLKVLLIKINSGPYQDKWAIPGGLVQLEETLDEAAKRVLFQKTNIGDIHLEQLYSFGDLERDIRGRSVSIAYFALIDNPQNFKLKTTPYYSEIAWWPVRNLPPMAFDHRQIVDYALRRLRAKLEYSNIVYSLLAPEFTLTDLQRVYEIVLGKKVDKRNFRKRVAMLGLVKKTGKKEKGEAHRPAQLYRFTKRELIYI